jgi:hypothetical protein
MKIETTISRELVPPPGGRLHSVRVLVSPQREWQKAINAASLDTPDTPDDYNVRKVGDLYPPTTGPVEEVEMILANFGPNGGSWTKVLAWGKANDLALAVPRQVIAIGEKYPKLHEKLGMNSMHVVATAECVFMGDGRAFGVWWGRDEGVVTLSWVSDCGGDDAWFAFVRPPNGRAGK